MTSSPRIGFWSRVGLGEPAHRAWALYDWANSAFVTTVVAAVFPVYFAKVAAAELPPAEATSRYALASAVALFIGALAAPVLGAVADRGRTRKHWLAASTGLGVLATAGLSSVERGDWLLAAVLFGVANIGLATSIAFYDSLLPHLARGDDLDRVSAAGYALGYLGGGLLLGMNLAWISQPERFGIPGPDAAARLSFAGAAAWWLLFSVPLFRRVPEPPGGGGGSGSALIGAFRQLAATFKEVKRYKHALLLLLAYLLYSDGINTIIRMAVIYGSEIGISQTDMMAALLLTQLVGVPFALAFGALASRIGPKRAIYLALVVYVGVALIGYGMRTPMHFYLLALAVGMVQGGSQALSRSLFASMIPRSKSSEFFGFFGVVEKVTAVAGPAVFAVVAHLTGSSRGGVLSVVAFFVAGAWVLAKVDVAQGRRAAEESDGGEATPRPASLTGT